MGDLGLFFEGNRPFLKYVYQPFLLLFGSNSLIWAFFSVLSRWLHAMSLYWLIRQIWPEKRIIAVAICLLAVVYPGFQAQFSSMIFGIAFLIFSLFILSLYFSIKAINSPRHKPVYLGISLLFSAVSLFTNEYFFTLEFIRYFLIWIFVKKRNNESQYKDFLNAAGPFLILFISAILWRFFQKNSETTYSLVLLNNLKSSFSPTLINQLVISLQDVWYTSIKIWLDSFFPSRLIAQQGLRIVFSCYVLVIALFFAIFSYLRNISASEGEETSTAGNTNILVFGIISIIFAGIPFWLAGLPVNDKYFFTRWTIPFLIGSCVIVPYLISYFSKNKLKFIILISILISLGAGTQFLAANSFRRDWNNQNLLYWEIKWRIPSLKENTVLFSDMLDFHYENSDQLSSGINFALMGKGQTSQIPYFLFYLPERINTSILPELRKDIPITGKRYYSSFKGNTSQAILIDFNPPGCLKVLDPILDLENPNLSKLTKQALFLSKTELINSTEITIPDSGSRNIIGIEPPKTWCFYFEKADLASQFHNWDIIGNLYQEVLVKEFKPRDGREWIPFIEGLSHLSEWNEASRITDHALETTADLEPTLCLLWKRISNNTSDSSQKTLVVSEIDSKLGCKFK
jgi:hypothetical protein